MGSLAYKPCPAMPDFRTSILGLRTILNVALVCVDSPKRGLIRWSAKRKVTKSLANGQTPVSYDNLYDHTRIITGDNDQYAILLRLRCRETLRDGFHVSSEIGPSVVAQLIGPSTSAASTVHMSVAVEVHPARSEVVQVRVL